MAAKELQERRAGVLQLLPALSFVQQHLQNWWCPGWPSRCVRGLHTHSAAADVRSKGEGWRAMQAFVQRFTDLGRQDRRSHCLHNTGKRIRCRCKRLCSTDHCSVHQNGIGEGPAHIATEPECIHYARQQAADSFLLCSPAGEERNLGLARVSDRLVTPCRSDFMHKC